MLQSIMQFKGKVFIYLLLLASLHTAGEQYSRAIKPVLLEENENNHKLMKSGRLGKYHARRNPISALGCFHLPIKDTHIQVSIHY